MTAAQIRFLSLVRREVNRFMKIKRQTVGAPLLETFLYICVFGAALGSRIKTLHGFDYVVFVIPGLIMMAWAINAFSNNASSILQQKFQRAIDDQLSSPASPRELLLAFSPAASCAASSSRSSRSSRRRCSSTCPWRIRWCSLPALLLVGFFFAQAGVLVGVRAEQFDDVSFAQTFVLQPLIFLGGVFYSASLLPEPFQTLTHFNPIYYMINLVRYGFLGYTEANVALSLGLLTLITGALFTLNYRLFARRLHGCARESRESLRLTQMGRLDEVDLSLKLSRKQQDEAARRGAGAARGAAAAARRPDRRRPARAAGADAVRGLGRVRQGRRDQASGGGPRQPARARRRIRGTDQGREAAPLHVALLPEAPGLGRRGDLRPHPGTGACWSSAWRASPARTSGGAATRRSSAPSARSRRRA